MAFSEKKPTASASQYVVQSIQAEIRKGGLKIGDKLPSEPELAESLGVSRSSVREGVKVLSSFGVLEVRKGLGTFVVDNFVDQLFQILGFDLGIYNLNNLLQVREIIETGAVKAICGQLPEERLNTLEALASEIDVDSPAQQNIHADWEFHRALVTYTDNSMLIRIYSMIRELINQLMASLMGKDEVIMETKGAHMNIVLALKENNALKAVTKMEKHLYNVRLFVDKYYSKG